MAEAIALHSMAPLDELRCHMSLDECAALTYAQSALLGSDTWNAPRVEISPDLLSLVVTWAKDEAQSYAGVPIDGTRDLIAADAQEAFRYCAKKLGFDRNVCSHDPHVRAALWPVFEAHLMAEAERLAGVSNG